MARRPLIRFTSFAFALTLAFAGLAATPGGASANEVAAVPPGADCHITPAASCVTVPVEIDRTDAVGMRAFSVTFTLSSELQLCSGLSSIVEGNYLSSFPGILLTSFQVLDNGSGSYTADCAILGTICGQTADPGTLFTIDVESTVADGTGTITITNVQLRDCANATIPGTIGPIGSVDINTTPPGVVSAMSTSQVKSGNLADGTTAITVSLTPPTDIDLDTVEVYRAPYGIGDGTSAYPEYDDVVGAGAPAAPTYPPGAPWTLTSVTGSGQTDEPTERGLWYYVAFAADDCGNVSAASSVTGGTLNYHLGDVRPLTPPDNEVTTLDISALGAAYGATLTLGGANNDLDVGPTADFSVDTLPTTDDSIDFEDLVVFAINFQAVSAPARSLTPTGELALLEPAIALDVSRENGVTVARLSLVDNPNRVKGIHAFLELDGMTVLSAEQGDLAREQAGPVFLATLDEGNGVWVDLALLGQGLAFAGSGEIAVLELEGEGTVRLGDVDLRDRNNGSASRHPADVEPGAAGQTTSVQPAGATTGIQLTPARPNPFNGATEIAFRLPASAPVSLTVHDVTGRLVRTLVDRTVGAGETSVQWDGRSNDGNLVGAGIYFYTFRTTDHQETRKLIRMN